LLKEKLFVLSVEKRVVFLNSKKVYFRSLFFFNKKIYCAQKMGIGKQNIFLLDVIFIGQVKRKFFVKELVPGVHTLSERRKYSGKFFWVCFWRALRKALLRLVLCQVKSVLESTEAGRDDFE
jgi:hypothetical protein